MRKNPIPAHALLDFLKEKLHCVNDHELAREIGCAPSMISKMRHGTCAVSAALILDMHEKFKMSVAEIKMLIQRAEDERNNLS